MKNIPTKKLKVLILLFPFFLMLACEKDSETSAAEEFPAVVIQGIPVLTLENRVSLRDAPGREALLASGNHWTAGISGFADNGFPALTGEYKLRGPSVRDEERVFSVHLTRESLYFPEEWQPLTAGSIPVFRRAGEEGFLTAALMDDGNGTTWTAIFRFPQGLEYSGLDDVAFDQLLRAWTAKFLYFVSLTKTIEGLSLPAVVEF